MSTRPLIRLAATVALLAAVPLLSACNTTAGAGRDLSNAGHAITNQADKAAQ